MHILRGAHLAKCSKKALRCTKSTTVWKKKFKQALSQSKSHHCCALDFLNGESERERERERDTHTHTHTHRDRVGVPPNPSNRTEFLRVHGESGLSSHTCLNVLSLFTHIPFLFTHTHTHTLSLHAHTCSPFLHSIATHIIPSILHIEASQPQSDSRQELSDPVV